MTADAQTANHSAPALKQFLAEKSVRKVLFIDDGFDPLHQTEPTEEERNGLWTEIEADATALELATSADLSGPDDLTGEVIAELLEREDSDPLNVLASRSEFVVMYASKTAAIRPVIERLRSFDLIVETAGESDWRNHLEDVSIVFLDWRLGQEGDTGAAIEAASSVAKSIHESRGPSLPMIVLISSFDGVKEHARSFSEKSGLVSGLFDAMPKALLAESIELQMTILCDYLEKGHVVQSFFDAVNRRTNEAAASFVETIRNLTLSDYANLQHFALKADGHPLGAYLTELLAGVWIDALFQGTLREPLSALDSLDFECLPSLTEPSEAVNRVYNSAMFDTHVGDFQPHPHADPTAAENAVRLTMGDVVVERDAAGKIAQVYVVINPQCDLAESPRSKRRIDDDLSVLLVPGELRPIASEDRGKGKATASTPYFAVGEQEFRVLWFGKKQLAVPYAEFSNWMRQGQRERKARMRTSFALELQTAIRSELTRVGLPVAPPMVAPIEARVYRASDRECSQALKTLRLRRLLMAYDPPADQVVLTREDVTEICRLVKERIEELSTSGSKVPRYVESVAEALTDPAQLQALAKPFQVPKKKTEFLGRSVLVCRESKMPSKFDNHTVLCVILQDQEVRA